MKPMLFDVKSLLRGSVYLKKIYDPLSNDVIHFHNTFEIAYIKKGKGQRIVGNSIERFTDGDLVIIPPYMPHANYGEAPKNIFTSEATVVYFLPDWLAEEHINNKDFANVKKLMEQMQQGLWIYGNTRKKIIREMKVLSDRDGIQNIISMLSILKLLAESHEYKSLTSIGYSGNYNTEHVSRIDEVYEFVIKNFKEKITLESIAESVHMTPTSFCKLFKNKTGKTLTSFVNEIRISYACKLLMNDGMDISEICYESGFNNLTSFNKNFKYFTKENPTTYRHKIVNARKR